MSIKALKRFEKNGKKLLDGGFAIEAAKAIRANTDLLETLNAEQMMEGKRADGSTIEPQLRNVDYAAQKPRNPKRRFLTPNLRDTGAFHRSITAKLRGKKITFNATDSKKNKLIAKYGKVLGLNRDSIKKYQDLYLTNAIKLRIISLLLG